MKQLLRRIDGWRFEAPLALLLALAVGFAIMAMPGERFGSVPVASDYGQNGRIGLAVLAALFAGLIGYGLIRIAGDPRAPRRKASVQEVPEPEPEPVPLDRLHRLRRADAHPDAPPREPIRASRDLGEPFMEINQPAAPAPGALEPPPVVIEGHYAEIHPGAGLALEALPHDEAAWHMPAFEETGDGQVHEALAQEIPAEDDPWAAHFEELVRREAETRRDAVVEDEPAEAAAAEAVPSGENPAAPGPVAAVETPAEEPAEEEVPVAPVAPEAPIAKDAPVVAEQPVAAAADMPLREEAPVGDAGKSIRQALAHSFAARTIPAEPSHAGRESLAAMMDRLQNGLARRAGPVPVRGDGTPARPPVRDMRPALRDALDELNRLASRRN